jgi:ubiquinone/menaquinone biosynthesis C-methylase UbiE
MINKESADQKSQQKAWNAIAPKWNDFRQRPIPEIGIQLKRLAEEWKPGKILDIGCGNCRNLIPFEYNDFDCYGIDFSEEMLKCAMEYGKKHELKIKIKQAFATELPFPEQYFNYILCISLLHHLNEQERIKALREIKRVLKPNGKAVIAVWNKLQKRFFLKKKDICIPWHVGNVAYQRYYHPFTSFELKRLLKKEGFKILSSNIFGRNLIFVVEK